MFSKRILLLSISELFCILILSEAQLKEWKIPCGAPYKPNNCENTSLEAFVDIEDFERCAPALLDTTAREYVWGAAGNGKTFFENKEAYNRIWIRGKRLRGFTNYSLETSVFGRTIPTPIGISPTAGQEFYHPEGEFGRVRGAANAGAVVILDQVSLTSLEDVAASVSNNTELWMQARIFPDREITLTLVHRAEAAGYKAIVVTLDQIYQTDIKCNARTNFLRSYKKSRKNPNLNVPNATGRSIYDLTVNFKDITWLSKITKLPIVVKGILTEEEAVGALRAGASAIFVSNQGGRELEDSLPTIDALPAIAKAVRAQFPRAYVFVDGGVRSGHDVFKALARGAHMAFVGRPAIWGLTVGGSKGVEKVINILKDDFKNAMLHAGFAKPSEITSSSIESQWIYSTNSCTNNKLFLIRVMSILNINFSTKTLIINAAILTLLVVYIGKGLT